MWDKIDSNHKGYATPVQVRTMLKLMGDVVKDEPITATELAKILHKKHKGAPQINVPAS